MSEMTQEDALRLADELIKEALDCSVGDSPTNAPLPPTPTPTVARPQHQVQVQARRHRS
jgi:hypothetical protein